MNREMRRAQAAKFRKSGLTPVSVQISIPSTIQWFARFGMDLLEMYADTLSNETPGVYVERLAVKNNVGSILCNQRAWMLEAAIEAKFSHVLFVDADQTFPPSTLRRLLAWRKQVVAANVATKQIPSFPTARKLVDGKPVPVFTKEDSSGLEQVWRVGTGIMLIDLSVLDKVEQPWFLSSSDPAVHRHGEDWWFVGQLEKAGVPVYIDHGVSRQVGHLGLMEYHHGHVPQELIEEMEAGDRREELAVG
jgi:hypothetical protein